MSFEMFPSSNNGNVDPYGPPFFNDIITSSNSKHDSQFDQSFFNLPSSPFNPLEDDFFHNQNGEFLLHQQQPLKENNSIFFNMAESHKIETHKGNEQNLMRKRCSKRDRHSKINTAQGPRDRRMRLSLKVAREFFDLQDKLCFDKGSKTVEWLLIQSRSAIKELSGTGTSTINQQQSASSTSECEVISGIEDEEAAAINKDSSSNNHTCKAGKTSSSSKGKKAKPSSRKTALLNPLAKELRAKARARARERTRSKKIELEAANKVTEINQLSSDPLETGEESVTQSQSVNHPSVVEVEAPAPTSQLATSESISDESWAFIGKWSPLPSLAHPFPILAHLYNSEFPQEQNQITDFQSFCKPMWECP